MTYIDKAIENANHGKVDLSTAVKGSVVHFRCGGSMLVYGSAKVTDKMTRLYDEASQWELTYYNNGKYGSYEHPFDIIHMDMPAFDWKDVRPGMGFIVDGIQAERVNYVGPCLTSNEKVVTQTPKGYAMFTLKCAVTRAPEHDIEVAQ